MKAVFCTEYGPPEVLQLKETEKPKPGDKEVLIKIYAATVTMGDCELRNLTFPVWIRVPIRIYLGYGKPKNLIPGMEFSGVIESVGKEVIGFQEGDPVFGSSGLKMRSYAEYKCQLHTYAMAKKPANVSFEEAAAIPVGGLNALHFLRKASIRPGQHILVNGAGGSIGTFGVQLAKLWGAEVTAVDSTEKLDMLLSIGADHVVDYTKEDFTKNRTKYDVVFDMVYRSSFTGCVRSLKSDGCYLMANTSPLRMLRGLWISKRSNKRMIFEMAGEKAEDLTCLAGLMAAGKIKTVIDRTYPLEKVVEAHAYVEQGGKKGNVVLSIKS